MSAERANTGILKRFVAKKGENLIFGVASLGAMKPIFAKEIEDVVKKMGSVVVLGHPVNKKVLETIVDKPNAIYKHHYQQLNWALDRVALELSTHIENMGFSAMPIPASSIVDWEKQRGHFSHRHAAIHAGLAWMGKNGLAVTERYGSQVRWVSILTDLPLECGQRIDRGCGNCRACFAICPAKAISTDGCDVQKCYEKLSEFAKMQGIGQHICGLCIKVCGGSRDGDS